MRIRPLPQFDQSAGRYFSPTEIISLEGRLTSDPECGAVVSGTSGRMRRLRHPYTLRQSDRGFYPVVVYLVNSAEDELILIDVISSLDEFEAMMKDPWTWAKAVNVGRLLQALWDSVQ